MQAPDGCGMNETRILEIIHQAKSGDENNSHTRTLVENKKKRIIPTGTFNDTRVLNIEVFLQNCSPKDTRIKAVRSRRNTQHQKPDAAANAKPENVLHSELAVSMAPILNLGVSAGLIFLASNLYLFNSLDIILLSTFCVLVACVYTINRYSDKKEDAINIPQHRYYFQRHNWPLLSSILAVAGSVALLAATNRLVMWHILLIVVAGVLYNIKIIPLPAFRLDTLVTYIRLKDIVLVKNIVVSIFWSCSAFIILMQTKEVSFLLRPDCLVIVICMFTCSMVNTMTSDLEDLVGDEVQGVHTFGTIFKTGGTYILLGSLGISASVFVAHAYISHTISTGIFLFFIGNTVWVFTMTSPMIKQRIHTKLLRELLTDSESFMCGLSLLVLSMIAAAG